MKQESYWDEKWKAGVGNGMSHPKWDIGFVCHCIIDSVGEC